ncbi:MAG: hypothetical protein CM1200mP18_18300 [Gammaproteobacteria bacterium]|nr:MAG: hypothetical protein CM1200mP18_18300 [Gammaproteobacteria bacterium]
MKHLCFVHVAVINSFFVNSDLNFLEFLSNYGLFLAKTVTLLAALLALVGFIATLTMRRKNAAPEHIELNRLMTGTATSAMCCNSPC